MDERTSSQKPIALVYATPPVGRSRPYYGALLALLAIVFGVFGLLMLFAGCSEAGYVFLHDNSIDFRGDLFQMIMILLIGAFSLTVAVRWARAVPRLIPGTD